MSWLFQHAQGTRGPATMCTAVRAAAVIIAAVLIPARAAVPEDEIVALPGWDGPLPSRHYSGYIDIAVPSAPARMLHYWLVEAEKVPPADAPLVRPPPPFCAKALGAPNAMPAACGAWR